MIANVNLSKRLVVIGIFFLSLFLPIFSSQAQEQQATTSSDGAVNSATNHASTVYKLESLLGDKVFGDFVLGPGKVEIEIKPGESKIVNLNVSNRIGEAKQFNFEIEDIGSSNNPTQPVVLLGDDTGPYTLKDYISIPDMKFVLQHNKRAIVPVTISIPEDAEPGGLYGSVLVNTVTAEAQKADIETNTAPASAIVSRIGTLFFITVPGDLNAEGRLKDFAIKNSKFWYEKGPIDFQVLFENTGSVHLNPYGELSIKNMLNEEVGYMEIVPWFTLPNSIRLREISWDRDMLYGKYTATLSLNRGYSDIIDEMSITFWVIPWKIIAALLVCMFLTFFMIRGFFRKFEFKRKD